MRPATQFTLAVLISGALAGMVRADAWQGYAGDPQHTAISSNAADPLDAVRWSTSVDLALAHPTTGVIYIHYGSPMVTAANTVVVPIRNADGNSFKVSGFDGATGGEKWSLTSDYIMPAHDWIPPYAPTLTPTGRLYYPGAGGTLYYRDSPDTATGSTGQIAFFGNSTYQSNAASFNSNNHVTTPLTSDSGGNIYFGFDASGGLKDQFNTTITSGVAKITPGGVTSWVATPSAVALNSAPAISNNNQSLYVMTADHLMQLSTSTLATTATTPLVDNQGHMWSPHQDSTAAPMVGPDGDVYVGTLSGPVGTNDRGWLLHFSGDLSTAKIPGAFGWDNTPSVIPASVVARMKAAGMYTGSASYLLMCKYNNYAGEGGNGQNKIAILDPTVMSKDPVTGFDSMGEVMTITGITPDPEFPNTPGAVREWCINTAAVDPATNSVIANSEDGRLYRWDLLTNTFSQSITLNSATGEAYTPTVIGSDGAVYAINDGILYSVAPEPASLALAGLAGLGILSRRRRRIF